MLSLDHMLPLNNTSDHISSAFFEKWKYALEFFEIFSDKFKCSVLVREIKKINFFMVIIMYFFLIGIVSNAPKSFHFRSLCFFFSQQSFCFLSLQRQRIQSCEADTIPKPALRNVQMFLLRTHFWLGTWHHHIWRRCKQSRLLYWMRPDVQKPHGLFGCKLWIFHRKSSFYSIWHWGFFRNNKLNTENYAVSVSIK